jgi:DNA modification methylase
LGDHKILCGNALVPESYDHLLDEALVDMLLTDPPYNDKISDLVGLGRRTHREFAMASGEMSREEFTDFLRTFSTHARVHSRNGACHFIFMDWRHLQELLEAGRVVYGDRLLNVAVWAKTNGGLGSLYRSRHELIVIYKCDDTPHVDNVRLGRFGRYRSNVWLYPGCNSFGPTRDEGLESHPTSKPVALLRDAILDVTNPNDLVLDCFGGSGSTLIAAHKAKRRARLIEIDPLYIDLTIRRWQNVTRRDAILATTGETFASVAARREEGGALPDPSTPTLKGGVS